MQAAVRRTLVVGAISLFGAVVGVSLGQFAAGGTNKSGADELAGYSQMLGLGGNEAAVEEIASPSFVQAGPSSYSCQGCDARLTNDIIPADELTDADTAPLPPYRVDEAPVSAVVRREASGERPLGQPVTAQRATAPVVALPAILSPQMKPPAPALAPAPSLPH